jgi:UrcA family protein
MGLARVIGSFSSLFFGESAMTRSSSAFLLHRASERVSAGAAAVALTVLTLLTVDARAAAPVSDPPSITVSYSDVAFGNTAGAAEVYRKLRAAARKVCGVSNGNKDLDVIVAARECYEEALADAVRKIDRPTLTALHTSNVRNFG